MDRRITRSRAAGFALAFGLTFGLGASPALAAAKSVVFLGVLTFIFAIGASAGSGNQEAFQLLDNAAGIVFALAYMVMFAIPLVARGEKAPLGVRIAAVSGGLMTLLYLVLAVFPVIDVKNPGIFTAKLVAGIVVLQVLAVGYFRNAVRAGKA